MSLEEPDLLRPVSEGACLIVISVPVAAGLFLAIAGKWKDIQKAICILERLKAIHYLKILLVLPHRLVLCCRFFMTK